jgi:hypothetical protein
MGKHERTMGDTGHYHHGEHEGVSRILDSLSLSLAVSALGLTCAVGVL